MLLVFPNTYKGSLQKACKVGENEKRLINHRTLPQYRANAENCSVESFEAFQPPDYRTSQSNNPKIAHDTCCAGLRVASNALHPTLARMYPRQKQQRPATGYIELRKYLQYVILQK